MPTLYLRNTITQKRYLIVEFHRDTGEVSLAGPSGGVFREKFNKDRLENMNYVLERDDA